MVPFSADFGRSEQNGNPGISLVVHCKTVTVTGRLRTGHGWGVRRGSRSGPADRHWRCHAPAAGEWCAVAMLDVPARSSRPGRSARENACCQDSADPGVPARTRCHAPAPSPRPSAVSACRSPPPCSRAMPRRVRPRRWTSTSAIVATGCDDDWILSPLALITRHVLRIGAVMPYSLRYRIGPGTAATPQ